MKNKIYTFAIVLAALLCGCSDDKTPDVAPAQRGTVTDDDGNTYNWVKIGNLLWTTSNAVNGTSLAEAEYYNNHDWDNVLPTDEAVEDYERTYKPLHGNPMNYEDAVASAPAGWRLPSDEDWKDLESALGMKDVDATGLRGKDQAFLVMGKGCLSELEISLGGGVFPVQNYGWIEMNLDFVGEHAFYWTSTIEDSYDSDKTFAYARHFVANTGKIGRNCMQTDCYLSVRWVKDAE